MGLQSAWYRPDVVAHVLRVPHVPAIGILTFQFMDALNSAIPACDGMGDNATRPT